MRDMADPSAIELSRGEIVALIDRESLRRLGLSGAELLRQYRLGTLDDAGRVADLLMLADLLPQDDEVFAAA
jgi:hypothetical protein